MSSQVEITENERKVLVSLYFNNYGFGGEGTWDWAVDESDKPSGLPKKSIPGVVGSLCKKKLATSDGEAIYMTDAGRAAIANEIKAVSL